MALRDSRRKAFLLCGLALLGGIRLQAHFREGVLAADIPALTYAAPFLYLGSLGAGVTVLSEGRP